MKKDQVEKMESLWAKYEKILSRFSDENINNLIETFGERILMCPHSTNQRDFGSYPGGVVEHSLEVASTMKKINESLNLGVSMSSILKVALLHEIGKVGDEDQSLFVTQDSSWHRENLGQNYKYNEKLSKMSVSHRTLYLLQKFNVDLTKDEWVAIQISGGSHFEENRFYVKSEPALAMLLQKSKSLSILMASTQE